MSDLGQQTEQRTCRFPGCERPAVAAEAGTGRPPEYCDDEGHNRAAAWRARRRLGTEPARGLEEEKRPVDAARQRASEIRGQVAGMVEHLGQQLNTLVEELRTASDPDAAEVEIETVTTEAAERVATASARASRAEQAQRHAETERSEADAAAIEATGRAEQLQANLTETKENLDSRQQSLAQVTAELETTRTEADAQHVRAQAELAQLGEQVAALQVRVGESDRERDDALQRYDTVSAARAEADERARGAVSRADTETARAERAEAELLRIREQLEQARTDRDGLRDQISSLRADLATITVERDAARTDIDREKTHGEQRVTDLRTTHELQLAPLREEVTELRKEAREQRSRADRAEKSR